MRNREAIAQVGRIAAGEAVCVALMLGAYGLLGSFTVKVLLGGLLGGVLAVLNFLFLSMAVIRAADRAQQGETGQATRLVQSSSVSRLLVLGAVLAVAFKADLCDPVAALLPLLFVRPIINVMEFFRKERDDSSCK